MKYRIGTFDITSWYVIKSDGPGFQFGPDAYLYDDVNEVRQHLADLQKMGKNCYIELLPEPVKDEKVIGAARAVYPVMRVVLNRMVYGTLNKEGQLVQDFVRAMESC